MVSLINKEYGCNIIHLALSYYIFLTLAKCTFFNIKSKIILGQELKTLPKQTT